MIQLARFTNRLNNFVIIVIEPIGDEYVLGAGESVIIRRVSTYEIPPVEFEVIGGDRYVIYTHSEVELIVDGSKMFSVNPSR
jgi:hypothetical protein